MNNYVLNAKSDLDSKTAKEQELLSSDKFKDLPEVKALKQQVDHLHEDSSGNNVLDNKAPNPIPSRQDIEKNLRKKMTALQSEYNGRLNGLISQAKSEYVQAKKEKKKISNSQLAQKYMGLAEGVEAECDARAYAVIAYAENELTRYNYSAGIADEARKAYQQAKSQRRIDLLDSFTK
ncbi:MAG: hypothetical protein VR69_14965 [Peptococcaceae bacterium BRH_c4b]|nr:MAG: hypothetical protein VR69_14965 [Peptococcaceae bacterium BRH_c4b]